MLFLIGLYNSKSITGRSLHVCLLFPELCLKESLCVGISSKLLLDASGTQGSELDSIYSLNDRGD